MTVNAELLTKPAELRREVIVHESVHLKVPNHGKLFRALVRAYLGQEERGDEID
jgi:predicted metal-dependent hydrolase